MTKPEGGKGPYATERRKGAFGSYWWVVGPGFNELNPLVFYVPDAATRTELLLNTAYAAGLASRDDLRKALEEASRHSTYGEDDEYGIRCCCKVPDYLPHAKHCELTKALSADEEAGK